MQTFHHQTAAVSPYTKPLETSHRIRWDIDKDVFRGRAFDGTDHFLPDGLSMVSLLPFLSAADQRTLSQIQGRTYANVFGLVERFINAKVLELSSDHWLGDQTALEALVGFSLEELKHQEMFRRIERMIAAAMPDGYVFAVDPDEVARVVLTKSSWAVLALTCHIELFTQVHYTEAIRPDAALSPLYKDVFLYHWKEESQHALIDELEWKRIDSTLTPAERDRAVDDFIDLVGAVDGILQAQSVADAAYFEGISEAHFDAALSLELRDVLLRAYRFQHILSGARHPRFVKLLGGLLKREQAERVERALAPIIG
jgi:hypothetical protein